MADTQQFFTGKLYVPVHMLKLPAEELLWSALHRMTQEEEAGGGGGGKRTEGRRRFSRSAVRLDLINLQDLSHRSVWSGRTVYVVVTVCVVCLNCVHDEQ